MRSNSSNTDAFSVSPSLMTQTWGELDFFANFAYIQPRTLRKEGYMQAHMMMSATLQKLAECEQMQYTENHFINALALVVSVFKEVPELAKEVGDRWGDIGLDETTIREMSMGKSVQDLETRKTIIATLKGYIALRAAQLAPPTNGHAPQSSWNGNAHGINMWAVMQETVAAPRTTPQPMPATQREVSRTVTEMAMPSTPAAPQRSQTHFDIDVVPPPEAVRQKLSGTMIFNPEMNQAVPETSGAFAKIVDKPAEPAASDVDTAIREIQGLRQALWAFDGGAEEWLMVVRLFFVRFTEDIARKLLRDAPITYDQFRTIVQAGAEESDQYAKFRNVFIERLRAFLTLRLLELCWDKMSHWPKIMEVAHEFILDEEWKTVFGASRADTPVRSDRVPSPRPQEVSRAHRHLNKMLQKALMMPW